MGVSFFLCDTVDCCEILHQFIDGLSHFFYRVSLISPSKVVQDFATIHLYYWDLSTLSFHMPYPLVI